MIGLAVLVSRRAALVCHVGHGRKADTSKAVDLFRQPAILACFAYFAIYTIGTIGLQTFAPATLNVAYGIPLAFATSAVTALLLGSTAGIVAGGFLASRTTRHDRVAATGLASAATVMILISIVEPPIGLLLPLFAVAGFCTGITGPSRDMIVRAATPAGAAGRVYGFVYSALDLGSMLGPVWFGYMLDHGMGKAVFVSAAACFLVAIATVMQVRRTTVARAA
jgi:predicted MFS family arabinose efflux permease